MKKYLLILTLLCCIMPALFGLSWQKYSNKELDYTLSYPSDWVVLRDKPADYYVCPPANANSITKPYIRVSVNNLTDKESKQELYKIRGKIFDQFKEYAKSDSISTFQIVAETVTEVKEIPAFYMVAQGVVQNTPMYYRFTYLIHKNKLYQLIIGCPKSRFEELSMMINVSEGLFSVK